MSRKYHTLCCRTHTDHASVWTPEFGAYSRADVLDELAAFRAHGVRSKDLRIITSGDRQADINAAVALLNGSK